MCNMYTSIKLHITVFEGLSAGLEFQLPEKSLEVTIQG